MTNKDRKRNKQKVTPPKVGVCALLREEGQFAKSHLIPQALTRTDVRGERFIETAIGFRPIRRFTSWYDHQLVTQKGEQVLSEIDTHGIAELRKHKLVWSGWGKEKKLNTIDYSVQPDAENGLGIRLIENIDSHKLRLFFLSLLWRALSTKIKEFSHLDNIGVNLRTLRQIVATKARTPASYHPIVLSQLDSRGFTHNHTPTVQEIDFPFEGGIRKALYYRFYMDGIVAHIYPEECNDLFLIAPVSFVGGAEALWVFTRRFEESKQYVDACEAIHDSARRWPGAF
ncbi:hypothetical protein AAUI01_04745 [Pseudomonas mosselii]|uniref:hypothetical protein n=1 Tax=Pseudomonas mosselii TaxID=78327 RepID=UPI0032E36D02